MPSLNLRNALKRDPNRLTLKQRAAALKATASRVFRRRPVAIAPAAEGADPRLVAMVAELLEARRKLNDPAIPDGPEIDAIAERETHLCIEIHRFPAQSIHDMRAKLPLLREEAEDAERRWDSPRVPFEESLPGTAWSSLLRDIEHLASAGPKAEIAPDPIFAAIEASKAAHAARDAWGQRFNGGAKLSPADMAEEGHLNGVQFAAHEAVLSTVPVSVAGRLALLEYLRWQMGLFGMADGSPPDAHSDFWPDAYKALRAALAFDAPARQLASAGYDPVHALIAEHRAAYAEFDRLARVSGDMVVGTPEYAAANEAQYSAGKVEVAALKALTQARATTLTGLLALTEYLPGTLRQVDQSEDAEPVLRNVAASLRAIGAPLTAEHTAPAVDLSGCSIRHLARLYETLSARWHIASVTMGAPFVWDGDSYTAAGRILDNECERLAKMMEDIAREMKGREVRDDEERDERLSVLVRQSIEGSGFIESPALVADIYNAWKA